MIALSARAVLRARNGAGNRIAPRGGEFPFSLPAGRMLAGCPRVTIFPALRELVSRATLSVATGRCCFCPYPHVQGSRPPVPVYLLSLRVKGYFVLFVKNTPLLHNVALKCGGVA